MQAKLPSISAKAAVAALCGGLAAGIMFAAAAKHLAIDGRLHIGAPVPARQLLPMMLAFLSPLPLMVTTIGFGTFAGACAALAGALVFGALTLVPGGEGLAQQSTLVLMGLRGAAAVVLLGSLLLGALARQPVMQDAKIDPSPNLRRMRPQERSIGRVLAAAVAVAAALVVLGAIVLIQRKGGYDAFLHDMVKQIQPILDADPNGKKVGAVWIARVLVWLGALTVAAECVCLLALNLWLAGRIAQTSGLLETPWPDLPRTLRVPTPLAILAAIAFGLSFAGGVPGLVSVVVAGAITAAFAFQGLAVVHQLTRTRTWRTPLLFGIYLAMSFFPPLMLIFAAAGLCDAAFFFRDRETLVVVKKPGPRKPGPWS